jgi:hemolysin activation/secretion protein
LFFRLSRSAAAGSSNLPPQYLAAVGKIYDLAMDLFTSTGAMVTPRVQQTTTALANGKVLIVGGTGNLGNIATGEVYDSASGQFTAVSGSVSRTREFAASALLLSGDVLITGGG